MTRAWTRRRDLRDALVEAAPTADAMILGDLMHILNPRQWPKNQPVPEGPGRQNILMWLCGAFPIAPVEEIAERLGLVLPPPDPPASTKAHDRGSVRRAGYAVADDLSATGVQALGVAYALGATRFEQLCRLAPMFAAPVDATVLADALLEADRASKVPSFAKAQAGG
jgi:hypothetical protein